MTDQKEITKQLIDLLRASLYQVVAVSRDEGLSRDQYFELLVELKAVMVVLRKHKNENKSALRD